MPDLDAIANQYRDALLERRAALQSELDEVNRRLEAFGTSANSLKSQTRAKRRRTTSRTAGRARASRGTVKPKLVEYLKVNPGSTAGEVAKALNLKATSVASMLSSGEEFAKNPKGKGYVVAGRAKGQRGG